SIEALHGPCQPQRVGLAQVWPGQDVAPQLVELFVAQTNIFQGSRRLFDKTHELRDIVLSARFHTRSDTALAHPAERLAQDDGAGGASIDVNIAGMDAGDPACMFALVDTLQSAREPEAGFIHERERLV